ncbi:MAG: thioredoxin family protein [Proteobacteria bacterium]|nr:thioredoxin family protein [Pseudomonadota bacterium]
MVRLSYKGRLIAVTFLIVIIMGICFSTPVGAQGKGVKAPTPAKSFPRLVDLGAKKCIPCIMMAPILEELKKEYKGIVQVDFIDVWENQNAGQKYGIRAIPTQIFYDASGKELYRHMGFMSKEAILARFQDLGMLPGKDSKKGK